MNNINKLNRWVATGGAAAEQARLHEFLDQRKAFWPTLDQIGEHTAAAGITADLLLINRDMHKIEKDIQHGILFRLAVRLARWIGAEDGIGARPNRIGQIMPSIGSQRQLASPP